MILDRISDSGEHVAYCMGWKDPHGVTFKDMTFVTVTAVKASNPKTQYQLYGTLSSVRARILMTMT
jgi:hypothetical protein